MNFYLHLLDGKPAFFDGYQVVYQTGRQSAARLEKDLRTIRRQQQATIRNREADGFPDSAELSYVRVRLPTALEDGR